MTTLPHYVATYALIDPGSQFTFMLDQIADFLEISSSETANKSLQYININHEMPVEYTRLIFGATSSPFCAIYASQKCALDNKDSFPLAYDAILNTFYMDDYIASLCGHLRSH